MKSSNLKKIAVFGAILVCATQAASQGEDAKPKDIKSFITDVNAGAVSASSIIGLNKTLVQQIQTSQDLVLAIQPLTSADQKTGYGIAVTPARTSILPLAAADYLSKESGAWLWRVWGQTTLSYAQNNQDISAVNYKKSGYSLDTTYYWNINQDPIQIAHKAVEGCEVPSVNSKVFTDLTRRKTQGQISEEAYDAEVEKALVIDSKAYKSCIDSAMKKVRWNATRFNFSYGEGRIKSPAGVSSSLGKMLTLNALIRAGDNGAFYLSARRVKDSVDPATLATTPTFKSSSLIAARFTYGSNDTATSTNRIRLLAEASNSKSDSPAAFKDVYLYALGIDAQIYQGVWLEFRVGKNRSLENGSKQTTSLLNLNFGAGSLFK